MESCLPEGKVRTISSLGEGVTSRTQAKKFVRQGRAEWVDPAAKTTIVFLDSDFRHECAKRSQEVARERAAAPRQSPAFVISEWVIRRGGSGPADPYSELHGVIRFHPNI